MKDKCEIIADLMSTDEGRQRIAHAMCGSKEPFVYRPSPPGHVERALANYYRQEANRQTSSGMAAWYNNVADGWEAYAILIEEAAKVNNETP